MSKIGKMIQMLLAMVLLVVSAQTVNAQPPGEDGPGAGDPPLTLQDELDRLTSIRDTLVQELEDTEASIDLLTDELDDLYAQFGQDIWSWPLWAFDRYWEISPDLNALQISALNLQADITEKNAEIAAIEILIDIFGPDHPWT